MKIIYVRHGETPDNVERRVQGQTSRGLTERGKEQAKGTALKLRTEKIDHIYSSDLRRAVETAEIIAGYHPGVPVTYTKDLRERYYGDWQGKTAAQVHWVERQKEVYSLGYRPGGDGETIEEIAARLKRVISNAFEKHRNDTVVFVSHGGVGRIFKALMMGRELEYAQQIPHIAHESMDAYEVDDSFLQRMRTGD